MMNIQHGLARAAARDGLTDSRKAVETSETKQSDETSASSGGGSKNVVRGGLLGSHTCEEERHL